MDLFDALMTCAIVPHHPFGVSFLEEYLRRLDMPDRDAVWSRYLYLAYSSEGPLDRLLDWAEKHPERAAALDSGHSFGVRRCVGLVPDCLPSLCSGSGHKGSGRGADQQDPAGM